MRGIICKVGCRLKDNTSIIKFKKGRLYPIIKRKDGRWELINHEEKKKITIDQRYITSAIISMRYYFIPYNPSKKKSRYEKWKKS